MVNRINKSGFFLDLKEEELIELSSINVSLIYKVSLV